MATSIGDSGDSCLTVLSQEKVMAFSVRNSHPCLVKFQAVPFHTVFSNLLTTRLTTSLDHRVRGRHVDLHGPDTSRAGGAKLYSEREGSSRWRMAPYTDAHRCISSVFTRLRVIAGVRCYYEYEMGS